MADDYQKKESDTVTTTETRTSFITNLGSLDSKKQKLKPAVFFTNSSNKTVRVYFGGQNQLLATGVSGTDFALESGDSQMFTSGIEAGTSTSALEYRLCDTGTPSNRLNNRPYDSGSAAAQYYVIDGFILSLNVRLLSVKTPGGDVSGASWRLKTGTNPGNSGH